MFSFIFSNIFNIIYATLIKSNDDKILEELITVIKKHVNLIKSYNIVETKYHKYYDLYNELFDDNHKNTTEYNSLVDCYNNLQEKYDCAISENKILKLWLTDSYIQIADRAKDIIISGGENVSSVEVEGCLMSHPAVSLCAVVAKPDEKWGEVPCAFVELLDGTSATEEELIKFSKEKLAGFKTPKKVIFQELPKTSTGKIQKFELRKSLG